MTLEAKFLGVLAHELTHSLDATKEIEKHIDNYENLTAYYMESRRMEGEALYWQYLTIKTNYNNNDHGALVIEEYWPNGEAGTRKINLYNEISFIIEMYNADPTNPRFDPQHPPEDLINKIGAVGGQMTIGFNLSNAQLTYDDYRRWEWLEYHTDMFIDYMEAQGIFGLTKQEAKARILESDEYSWDIKVLLDTYNNYIGSNHSDILSAKENGSALGLVEKGTREQGEVLWGGGGNDILRGSSIKDTLMGGADHDILYGNGGDDLLSGGSGHDRLYGGTGNDAYYFNVADTSDVAPDLVRDDQDGEGEIVFYVPGAGGTSIPKTLQGGSRAQGDPENTFKDASGSNIWYRFQPSTDEKDCKTGSLFIYYNDTLVTVIKDFQKQDNGYLGLTLTDPPAGPEKSVISTFDAEKGRYIKFGNQLNANIKTDLAAGDKADGSGPADVVVGGAGSEEIALGNGDDYFLGQRFPPHCGPPLIFLLHNTSYLL